MDRLGAMATFVRVVETGSFSAAARQLGVGQPAVSKMVAQLEERLGVALMLRTTRGLTPTEAGLAFAERARRALEEADEAELAARGEGAGLTGLLRASAPTTLARLHLVPRLGQFLAEHPGLAVDLILDDRVIDLVGEGIDVSLRTGELADSAATARRLATAPRAVVATPGYLAARGVPEAPSDLARHALVLGTARTGPMVFRRPGETVSVALSSRLRLSGAEGVRAAVLADLGLAIASRWMFAPELADGRVVTVLEDWSLPGLDLWAVFPTGRLASAKARAFAAFAGACVAG